MESAGIQRWRLTNSDGFVLTAPDGGVRKLPYRKLYELLLLLPEGTSLPRTKEDLAFSLWPNAPKSKQELNLRQALYQLRSILGSEFIASEPSGLRLAPNIALDCSGLVEPYCAEKEKIEIPPVDAFLTFLEWLAASNPVQMLELMRANVDISLGATPDRLHKLLDIAVPQLPVGSKLEGWVPFWRGHARLMSEDIEAAISLFRISAEEALRSVDHTLLAECLLWLGSSEILLSRIDSASRVAEQGKQLARSSAEPLFHSRVNHLEGTIMIHQGRLNEGLLLMEEASGQLGDRVLDRAINEALRALYLVCGGRSQAAVDLLARPQFIGEETGHLRLKAVCDLAKGYLDLADGDANRAILSFTKLISDVGAAKESHFEIYAREAIATAYSAIGESGEARTQLKSSQEMRRTLHMSYTAWDRMRLRPSGIML